MRSRFTAGRRVTVLLVVVTVALGAATYRVAGVASGHQRAGRDLAAGATQHLAYLRSALEDGAGERMQNLFPEGYFFTHVLYGLTWTELGERRRVNPELASVQARWALDRLSTQHGTAPFDPSLRPAYGVFYAGWELLLRSNVATLQPSAIAPAERGRIQREADSIAAALTQSLASSGSPFLQAYPGAAWPVDTVVAMAGLRAADAALQTDHRAVINRWLASVPAYLDPVTGLLPHRVNAGTGATLQGARGSSQSLIQRFWPAIDPAGAPASYRRYRQRFTTSKLGVIAVREYPKGVSGSGDVDSGPLLLGASASASAVTIGAALANGDRSLAFALAREAEVFAVPVTWHGERRYAAGTLPAGDAFLLWSRVTDPAPGPAGHAPKLPPVRALWMWWLLLPWLALLSGWSALYAVCRLRRQRYDPGSSKGRTAVFGTAYGGSNPPPGARS